MPYQIIVLEDGTTYSKVDGASILVITAEAMSMLDDGYEPKDLDGDDVLSEIVLSDKTPNKEE